MASLVLAGCRQGNSAKRKEVEGEVGGQVVRTNAGASEGCWMDGRTDE